MANEADQLTTELLALWKAQILGQVALLRTLCAAGVLAPHHAVEWLDEFDQQLDTSSVFADQFVRPVLTEAREAFARITQ